ncbi:MAG: transcription termination/antitermination protein NusG [Alphaproteobacteria bacterium]|nr:transcription termination/antitermination protein NusG [Alphaproteobacteria bacterium]
MARWYALKVFSGAENRILQEIENTLEENGMRDALKEGVIPSFEHESMRSGKRIVQKKRFFSGYIFLKIDFSDKIWYLVKGVERVIGFAGTRKGTPKPISDSEAEAMLARLNTKVQEVDDFVVGQSVRVRNGPFATMQALVQEVDLTRRRLKVVVTIFGRSAPVDLDFVDVEKV